MKNTRIARLKQSKRVKQAAKLLTVGLLVCPLAIGTIKALADEAETAPPVEQVEEKTVTTEETVPVEETETSEPVQPEVVEEIQTEEPTVIEESSTEQQTIETPVSMEQSQEDTETIQAPELYTYYIVSNIVDDNGNIIETRRSPETAVKDSAVEVKAINWYGYYLLPGTPSEYSAQITQDGTQEFVFTYLSATSEKHRDPVKDKQIDDLFTELYNLHEELAPKAQGTEFEDQLQTIYYKFDDISHIQGQVKEAGGLLAWYEYSLPKLPSILEELKALADKISALQPEALDKTKLEQAIKEAEAKLAEGGWKDTTELETALTTAKEVLANTASTQVEIDSAVTSLNTATSALEKEDIKTPSTAKLESSIKDAEAKLTANGYTAQSMNALKQALQNAKDILANASSTQAEIDEAQKALDLAIANLVKEDNSNGGNTGNNSSNDTGNSSSDPNNSSNGTNSTNNQSNNKQNNTTTTKPAGNNTTKDGLPQTGEQSATNAVIAGLSLTMFSIFAWFKRKKV